ncbi:hypothetical protein RAA17_15945 [Komagataeibacter rhaeticus]|nr:hypothetical protein [Komagataeibacter rhaeticus]
MPFQLGIGNAIPEYDNFMGKNSIVPAHVRSCISRCDIRPVITRNRIVTHTPSAREHVVITTLFTCTERRRQIVVISQHDHLRIHMSVGIALFPDMTSMTRDMD